MKNKLPTAFTDVVFLLVICLFFLWYLAFLTPEISEKKKPTAKPRTEFMMTTIWSNKTNSDVDHWAKYNDELICGHRRREQGHLILANDWTNSGYLGRDDDAPEIAREVLNILKKKEGTYYFSLQGYRITESTKATVIIERVEPYEVIYEGTVDVLAGEEHVFLKFYMDSDGKVSNKVTDRTLLEVDKFLTEILGPSSN